MGRTTRHFNNALGEKGDAPKKLRAVLKEKNEKHNVGTSFSKPSVAGMLVENLSMSAGDDGILNDKIINTLQQIREESTKFFASAGNSPAQHIGFGRPSERATLAPGKGLGEVDGAVAISGVLYDKTTGKPYVKMMDKQHYDHLMRREPNSQVAANPSNLFVDDAEGLFSKEILESKLYQNIRDLVKHELPLFSGFSKEIKINDNPVNLGKVYGVFGGIYLNYTTKEGKKIIINVDVDKEKESFILAYKNGNKVEVNEEILDSINKDLLFDK